MRSTRRATALVASLATTAMLVTACSGGSKGAGADSEDTGAASGDTGSSETTELSGTVKIWTWTKPGEGLTGAIEGFSKIHPNVTIDVQDVGNPAIWDMITTGMAANGQGLPDIMNIGIDYMGGYLEKFPEGLANLSELGADDLKKDFPDGVWASASTDAGNFGIPFEVNTVGLYYRTDIFDTAGVNAHDIKDWDGLLEAGKKVLDSSGKPMFSIDKAATVADSANLWQNLTLLQGAFYFNDKGEITLNGPEGVRAMEFIRDANDMGLVADLPGGWDNMIMSVKEELTSTLLGASWMAGVFPKEWPEQAGMWKVRSFPPADAGGATSVIGGATYLSISNASENKEDAWEFIKYALGTMEGQESVYENGGLFPGFLPLLKSEGFTTEDEYFGGEKVNEVFVKQLEDKTPSLNFTSDYSRALKAVTDAQTQVLLRRADPKEALDAAAKSVAEQTGREIAK